MSSIAAPRQSPSARNQASQPRSEHASLAKQWAAAESARRVQSQLPQQGVGLAAGDGGAVAPTTSHAAGSVPVVSGTTAMASMREQRIKFTVRQAMLIVFFSIITLLHVAGLYLFTSGFLLTRMVLQDKSECGVPPISLDAEQWQWTGSKVPLGVNVDNGCWHPKTFKRAVVIIIDALRYDFTVPSGRAFDEPERHYQDALQVLYKTAVAQPGNAVLLPFIADPPTTTLQRLKGLTTGTLPTFIDAGSNFAGEAIDEDNLLWQLRMANKTIVHIGDDTWHALFPGYFEPEFTRPFDSFNVWDLHTVDNGVIEHLGPLLKPQNSSRWDLLIGHLLGVDHAGHRYGPDHPAMATKLRQMDSFIEDTMQAIDDDTLLVVMGDHGMDSKGDHGGESDEEIEAALWLYSKRQVFGQRPGISGPPLTAKDRPIAQIDLVPTLALLLGLPIPFNNLGSPIFEAFAGSKTPDYKNLARVQRLASAQISRYMAKYSEKRDLSDGTQQKLWQRATDAKKGASDPIPHLGRWQQSYQAYREYQVQTLKLCKELWAQFNVVNMIHGIEILAFAAVLLVVYSKGIKIDYMELTPVIIGRAVLGLAAGALLGSAVSIFFDTTHRLSILVYTTATTGSLATASPMLPHKDFVSIPLPRSIFAWTSILITLGLSFGFASNSYTIWEDRILVFFLGTIACLLAAASLRQEKLVDRAYGCYHAILFAVLTRISSLSRLCREEQMPFCKSTYYSSTSSSTAAAWHVAIPGAVALLLPGIIKQYFDNTRSYHQAAVLWNGIAFRGALSLSAAFWLLNIADDNSWWPTLKEDTMKSSKVMIAQTSLGLSLAVGYALYAWSAPFLEIVTTTVTEKEKKLPQSKVNPQLGIRNQDGSSRLTVHGLLNVHGARYLPLVTVWTATTILFQKPLGAGATALLCWQILCLVEILAATSLSTSSIGPITLALLGSFHYFTTGHQATLSSLQWDAAFIPLHTVRQPYSALFMALNTFGPQIICSIAVPLVPLWRAPARSQRLFSSIASAIGTYLLFYTVIALATCTWAMWLRRHLMLFRVFCPRFLLAGVGLVVVDVVIVLVALVGLRWWGLSVGEVLGMPD